MSSCAVAATGRKILYASLDFAVCYDTNCNPLALLRMRAVNVSPSNPMAAVRICGRVQLYRQNKFETLYAVRDASDMIWGCIQALPDLLKQITDVSCLHVIDNFNPTIWIPTLLGRELPKHHLDELVLPLYPGLALSLQMWIQVCVHFPKISFIGMLKASTCTQLHAGNICSVPVVCRQKQSTIMACQNLLSSKILHPFLQVQRQHNNWDGLTKLDFSVPDRLEKFNDRWDANIGDLVCLLPNLTIFSAQNSSIGLLHTMLFIGAAGVASCILQLA